jgi:hypothetical protein
LHLPEKVSLTNGAVLTFNYNYENYYSGPYSLAQRHLRSGWEGWGLTALDFLLPLFTGVRGMGILGSSHWTMLGGIMRKGCDTR